MPAELEWREVPAGPFPMGSDPVAAFPPDEDETPRRTVRIEPFRLSRTPVTNAQYRVFAESPTGDDDVPATYLSLDEARAFCAWAGVRLPSEAEWEAAARGGDDRLWPWGDEPPDSSRAVFAAGIGRPQPVGRHARGASRHGVLDLAGNVWEWVTSPYRGEPGIVRGGAFVSAANELRCSFRQPMVPGARDHYIGFRVALAEGEPRLPFDWIEIPGGEIAIGRDSVSYGGPALADELPRHTLDLPAFELTLTPVTNAQYALFVRDSGAEAPAHWPGGSPPPKLEEHPVTFVDWFAAGDFCTWAGGRLPTEAEWEKAARGVDSRVYPWGDAEDAARAHIGAGLKSGSTVPVGAHAGGASPYGLLDMAGNVWEWVSSAYRPYPYVARDGREEPSGSEERVLRGGSFASPEPAYARCAMRSRSRPGRRQAHIGFRVAKGASA